MAVMHYYFLLIRHYVNFSLAFISRSVCLLAGLCKNYSTDLDKILHMSIIYANDVCDILLLTTPRR